MKRAGLIGLLTASLITLAVVGASGDRTEDTGASSGEQGEAETEGGSRPTAEDGIEGSTRESAATVQKVEMDAIEGREGFLEAFCGGKANVGRNHCKTCPSYTSGGGSRRRSLRPGHMFSVSDLGETSSEYVIASFENCEPRAGSMKNTVVLEEKRPGGWRRVYATDGYSMADCRPLEVPDVPAAFVCKSAQTGFGVQHTGLAQLILSPEGSLKRKTLLGTVAMGGNPCNTDVYKGEKVVEAKYDADARALILEVSARHVRVPDDEDIEFCSDFAEKYELPEPETYDLEYDLRDGLFRVPTDQVDPETHQLKGVPIKDEPTTKKLEFE